MSVTPDISVDRTIDVEARRTPRRLSICLINPRYDPFFWGYDFAMPLIGGDKRCWMVTGALPTLAALVPEDHDIEVLDENIESIDFEKLQRFDVIGLTGMIVQAKRMREILLRLRQLDVVVAVGGPYVSVDETAFLGLYDARFVGEAEETWPVFLDAVARGEPIQQRYEQLEKTDMAKAPTPRFDLIKSKYYAVACVQFSRGCPFLCEFCDIITIFGRRPRLKQPAQLIRELEAVRNAGFTRVFLVDDNFIGNKAAAKKLLRELIPWQKKNGYPLIINTEASINLADDPELLDLMLQANFLQVFIGIESPRAESLAETRKVQNIRGDSMPDKISRVRDAGLVVHGGFIVGFDNDDERIFDEQYRFVQHTGIANAGIAILTPIPTTPLYDRLKAEGRLDFSDPEVVFLPKQMSRERLKKGYTELMQRLYNPVAYFERLFKGYSESTAFRRRRAEMKKLVGSPPIKTIIMQHVRALFMAGRLARALSKAGHLRELGLVYLRVFLLQNLPLGREAISFPQFMVLCIGHWHFFNIAHLQNLSYIGNAMPNAAGSLEENLIAAE